MTFTRRCDKMYGEIAKGRIHMRYLLGVDLGTSGLKTVLFDEAGRAKASHTVEYEMRQPHNGWAEQDPEDWYRAVCEGARAVIAGAGVRAEDVVSVGLSGQMHGLVMLDDAGHVLRPAILWCDQRTGAQAERMKRLVGEKRLIEITANPAMTGFTAAKILWVQENEPALYARCRHILLPKDYIRYRLTGEWATEVSDASGMQLMDVARRCWSGEVLERLSIDRALLAPIYESPDVTGCVHARAAEETGLRKGTPVVGGAADNSAAAVGTGVVRKGTAFTTLGTSGVVYAIADDVSIDPQGRIHTLCASVPGKWTAMSCTLAAGLSLRWLRDTCCEGEVQRAAEQGVDPYVLMGNLASCIPIGADRLIYLPYLMGERCPHPDPNCRGVFFGLSAIHSRAHLIRAVMEGVAYSQAECVEVFRELGVPVERMTACGGGARSPLWRQMLSDLYGCPVSTLAVDEGPALGAAILAGVGAGVYASVEEGADAVVERAGAQEPDAAAHTAYQPYFDLYKRLYRTMRADFKALAAL